jgi:hypothetical protein
MGPWQCGYSWKEGQVTVQYFGDGRIRSNNFEIVVTDRVKSDKLVGYRLPASLIERLIDENVDNIIFVDPNRGRYTISLDDWLDYRVWGDTDQYQHVSQGFMDRG